MTKILHDAENVRCLFLELTDLTLTPWVRGQEIPYTDKFTYLGSVLCQDGGTGVDIKYRLNKARNALMRLRSVWRSASYSINTKLRIYQSCVLPTLLYDSE